MSKHVKEVLSYIEEDICPKIFERIENGNPADLGCNFYMKVNRLVCDYQSCNIRLMYNGYINLIKDYARKIVNIRMCSSKGKNLIVILVKSWKKHKILVYYIQKIFYHLDTFNDKEVKLTPIIQAGLNIFKSEVFDSFSTEGIRAAFIEQIRIEREGNKSNYAKKCLTLLSEIAVDSAKIYKRKNQKKVIWEGKPNYEFSERILGASLLEEARIYYASKPSGWMSTLLVPENCEEAIKIFKVEAEKVRDNANLQNKLLNAISEEIIKRISSSWAEISDIRIFDVDKRDEVKMMFEILKKYENAFQCITARLKRYIENRGTEIISDEKLQQDPIEYTTAILNYKIEIDELIENLFSKHFTFQNCMSSAFRNFINKFDCTTQNIAYYSDYMMKKGVFGISESEIDRRLSSLAIICGWLSEKDIWVNIYTRLLAKRLLAKTSMNNDAEKMLIEKLKTECGYTNVNKIYSLYQDIALSEDILTEFNQSYDQDCPQNIQFTAQILRYGGWPGLSSEACLLPYEFKY